LCAEELIRGILSEIGLGPDEVNASMENLFEETVKVSTTETYEQESKKVPDDLKVILDQAVTRAAPGLKFA
jgi:division protein CdvB (Snf7/Vps24/ESCRT-III family)